MPKLNLIPDEDGYSLEPTYGVLSTELRGGFSRLRVDKLGAPIRVSVSWKLSKARYEYLQLFYRNYKASSFTADLLINTSTLEEYECKFVANSLKLTSVQGMLYTVSATLEVEPKQQDVAYDELLLLLIDTYGADEVHYIVDLLDIIVNESLVI